MSEHGQTQPADLLQITQPHSLLSSHCLCVSEDGLGYIETECFFLEFLYIHIVIFSSGYSLSCLCCTLTADQTRPAVGALHVPPSTHNCLFAYDISLSSFSHSLLVYSDINTFTVWRGGGLRKSGGITLLVQV